MHTQKTLNSFFTAADIYTDTTTLNSGRLVYFALFLSLFRRCFVVIYGHISVAVLWLFAVICFCWDCTKRVMSVYTCLMLVSAWFFSALSCFYSFLKRETATFGAASHMITTALFRVEPNWCGGFNPVYGIV